MHKCINICVAAFVYNDSYQYATVCYITLNNVGKEILYHFIYCSLALSLSPCQIEWFIQGVFPSPYLSSLPLFLACFLSISCLLILWSPSLPLVCVCLCWIRKCVWLYRKQGQVQQWWGGAAVLPVVSFACASVACVWDLCDLTCNYYVMIPPF